MREPQNNREIKRPDSVPVSASDSSLVSRGVESMPTLSPARTLKFPDHQVGWISGFENFEELLRCNTSWRVDTFMARYGSPVEIGTTHFQTPPINELSRPAMGEVVVNSPYLALAVPALADLSLVDEESIMAVDALLVEGNEGHSGIPFDLPDLKVLHLNSSQSLCSFCNLSCLQKLRIDSCYALVDWSAITGLSALADLHLEGIAGPNHEQLTELHGLRTLHLWEPADTNLAWLSSLPNLVNLSLFLEANVDFSPFGTLLALERLALVCRDAPDLRSLAALANLIELDICVASPLDWSCLPSLPTLRTLKVRAPAATSRLMGLPALPSLSELAISVRDMDMALLSELRMLRKLTLGPKVDVRDFGPFAELPELQELDLSGSVDLISLNSISRLANLRKLTLSGCVGLADIDQIRKLQHLEEVDLSECSQLFDLGPLSGLGNLLILDITGCAPNIGVPPLAPECRVLGP